MRGGSIGRFGPGVVAIPPQRDLLRRHRGHAMRAPIRVSEPGSHAARLQFRCKFNGLGADPRAGPDGSNGPPYACGRNLFPRLDPCLGP